MTNKQTQAPSSRNGANAISAKGGANGTKSRPLAIRSLEWLSNAFPLTLKIIAGSLLLNLVLGVALTALLIQGNPPPIPIGVDQHGRATKLEPINKPVMTGHDVKTFAARAISSTFSFNAADYTKVINNASEFFFDDTYATLKDAMEKSGGLAETVINGNMICTTIVTDVSLEGETVHEGAYAWKIKVVASRTFRTPSGAKEPQIIKYTLIVKRIDSLERGRQVAISRIVQDLN